MGENEGPYDRPFNIKEGLHYRDGMYLISNLVWPETEN